MALKIENLTGGYSGINVIKNVNLTIEPGQAVGLIGLNGAGKSTTIKHLLGLLRMQKGKIILNGVSLTENPAEFKKMVAYIPETPILYPELTLKEHLELVMLTYDLDHDQAWARAKELCKMFRLENKLDWLPINFSKGMKQTTILNVDDFIAVIQNMGYLLEVNYVKSNDLENKLVAFKVQKLYDNNIVKYYLWVTE